MSKVVTTPAPVVTPTPVVEIEKSELHPWTVNVMKQTKETLDFYIENPSKLSLPQEVKTLKSHLLFLITQLRNEKK